MVFDGITPVPNSGWMVCLKANGKISVTLDDGGAGQLSQVADHCKKVSLR